MVNYSAEG